MEDDKKKSNTISHYLSGFNRGYMISREHPDIAAQIKDSKSDAPFMRGIRDGNRQFEMDTAKSRGHRPAFLKDQSATKETSPDMSPDVSPDKDIEPEMD